ncbi:MAG: amidophosphoribosyltransferase [Candidatus Muiribacteriaceae bacterium]
MDSMHEECGIFGIVSPERKRVGNITYFGLYALQHRGQESAGIAVSDGERISYYKRLGVVNEVFSEEVLEELQGKLSVGHVRYSTAGGKKTVSNAQPLVTDFKYGMLALAHNGNLTNYEKLKQELEEDGAIFQSDSDSEVLIHLIARSGRKTFREALLASLPRLEGAFSLIAVNNDKIYAIKDRHSIRPLCMGRLRKKLIFSSESCALDMIDGTLVRELEPGEVVCADTSGNISSEFFTDRVEKKICSFEYIYFSRPDSQIFGQSVHEVRKRFGAMLAEKYPVQADVVIPVPDSGISAALGYGDCAGIPYDKGIIRNHYIGRTFIQPMQELRNMKVKMKLNPVPGVVKGKKVVVVDDSVVRGTTSKQIVKLLRNAGAEEVHLRISSPMITGPCRLGIDTPTGNELIANRLEKNDICRELNADSIEYLSVHQLRDCLGGEEFCLGCFQRKE